MGQYLGYIGVIAGEWKVKWKLLLGLKGVRVVGLIPIGVILGFYWGFIGIMENNMETIIKVFGVRVVGLIHMRIINTCKIRVYGKPWGP